MITLQWTLQFCRFQSVNVVFSLFLVFKFEFEKKKNWKSKKAAASDVIMLLWLPWNPLRQHVVSINWKYKERSLYVPKYLVNQMNGVKSRRGGVLLTPPALMTSCNFSRLMSSRVNVYVLPFGFNECKIITEHPILTIRFWKNILRTFEVEILKTFKNIQHQPKSKKRFYELDIVVYKYQQSQVEINASGNE